MIAAALLLAATVALESPVKTIQTIRVPNNQIPTEIVHHAGALWFVSWHNWPEKIEPFIGRISLKGTIRLTEVMNGSMPGLTARSGDGTLWLSDRRRKALWHVLANGKIIRLRNDQPTMGIAVGPDGAIWCTHPNSPAISTYNTDGSLRARWQVPKVKGVEPRPNWIVAGSDSALWFTDPATDSVGRITTAGAVTMYPLPKGWKEPGEIFPRTGVLWFAVGNQPLLGRIDLQGKFTSVKIHAPARAVASDHAGRMWYSDGASAMGWILADGTTDYVVVSEEPGAIRSIAGGPDGAMWFVDEKTKMIGRVELAKPAK